MNLSDAARFHLDLGHSLLPIDTKKQPHVEALKQTGYTRMGKNKYTREPELKASWKKLQSERPELSTVLEWLKWCPGLAIVTGALSKIIIIDVDAGEGIIRFQSWGLEALAHARTPSGGLHWGVYHPNWYVPTLQSQTNENLSVIKGIDIRADGGYAIIPPSSFGIRPYQLLRSYAELDDPLKLPDHVTDLFSLKSPPIMPTAQTQATTKRPSFVQIHNSGQKRNLTEELISRTLGKVSAGDSRNNAGMWLAVQLRDNNFAYPDAVPVMANYVRQTPATNLKGQHDPYTMREALHSLEQAYSRPGRNPWRQRKLSMAEQLELIWPELTPDEKETAALCCYGSRGQHKSELILTIRRYDLDLALWAAEEIQKRTAEQTIIPGINSLNRIIKNHL